MIAGIGYDLCEISRMEKSLATSSFPRRVFGAEEWTALEALSPYKRAESAAANFAAKEAFLKAAGTGLGGFPMAEMEFLREESGRPCLKPSGKVAAFLAENHYTVHVSLTHETGLAGAVVILEKCD